MLEAEAALAAAEAEAGVIPAAAAEAIAAACRAGAADVAGLGRRRSAPATRSSRWSRALRDARSARTPPATSTGARRARTSLDTAAMLVARRALALVVEELDGVARACAGLAREHAGTADGRADAAAAGAARSRSG